MYCKHGTLQPISQRLSVASLCLFCRLYFYGNFVDSVFDLHYICSFSLECLSVKPDFLFFSHPYMTLLHVHVRTSREIWTCNLWKVQTFACYIEPVSMVMHTMTEATLASSFLLVSVWFHIESISSLFSIPWVITLVLLKAVDTIGYYSK